ncbi:MAG: hypothetical protein A2Y38_20305 [Spirochaetes bacterium GWB1_59_5]|nr:MAG: hypothetical protein A2Y38_20305 [Spirochaetes bacterium GWB1_59_5]
MIELEYTLAIDPGTKKLGWAIFFEHRLLRVGLSETKLKEIDQIALAHAVRLDHECSSMRLSLVVVEDMRSYALASQKGDQNDLIHLAQIGAFIAGYVRPERVMHIAPAQWKGQMPKDVSHRRIEERLFAPERAVLSTLPDTGKRQHAMDAVGVGLCALGRRA